ncbi:hypothetical protein DL771_012441 [Monosporascus sp. 5C6A]|nr:hypothetical protein DL771_012441 [Monosporascus sp. 5C6A]
MTGHIFQSYMSSDAVASSSRTTRRAPGHAHGVDLQQRTPEGHELRLARLQRRERGKLVIKERMRLARAAPDAAKS